MASIDSMWGVRAKLISGTEFRPLDGKSTTSSAIRSGRLGGLKQRLLQPIGLRLHAVDQHADDLPPVDAPAFEHWRGGLFSSPG